MQIMASLKIVLDVRRAKKDGEYPLKLQITHKGKVIYISTNISALESQFKNGVLNRTAQNWQAKNIVLRNMLSEGEMILLDLERKSSLAGTTINSLKSIIEAKIKGKPEMNSPKPFIEYIDEFISLKSKPNTIEIYKQTKLKLLSYDPQCTFESMNMQWLTKFDLWMQSFGLKTNGRSIHMRNIRAVFNYAIDEEITTLYPFRRFKIKSEETRKRSLSIDQLILLRDYPCEDYQKRYRDIFMLMLYLIGVNAVDLFNTKSLVDRRLEYERAKTGKLYSIKVEPEAMEIIERYKGEKHLLYILDEYNNYKDFLHRMSMGLKQIGECKRMGLGGKKIITPLFPDISSYWARHTWATIAASLDIPKETISAALGHEFGNKVTSIYINFDQQKVDDANRKVIDYINTYQNMNL